MILTHSHFAAGNQIDSCADSSRCLLWIARSSCYYNCYYHPISKTDHSQSCQNWIEGMRQIQTILTNLLLIKEFRTKSSACPSLFSNFKLIKFSQNLWNDVQCKGQAQCHTTIVKNFVLNRHGHFAGFLAPLFSGKRPKWIPYFKEVEIRHGGNHLWTLRRTFSDHFENLMSIHWWAIIMV